MIERLKEFAKVNGFVFEYRSDPILMDTITLYFRNPENDRNYSTRIDPEHLYSVDPHVLLMNIQNNVIKELN